MSGNTDQHDVSGEPHFAHDGVTPGAPMACWRCGYSRAGIGADACPECGSPPKRPYDGDPDASVWDEPTTSQPLAGATPADALTYERWLDARLAERDVGRSWAFTGLIALAAGPAAIIAAFCGAYGGSGQTFASVFALVIFGPMIEETMKVTFPTYAVERRPHWFLGRSQILICAAAGGLVFAVIENLIYLRIYVPNPTPSLVAWRWTVCVALHVGCSMIAGIGLAGAWARGIRERRRTDLVSVTRWIVVATVVHGTYNGLAVILGLAGMGP